MNICAVGEQSMHQCSIGVMERTVTIDILCIQVCTGLFKQAYDFLALSAADGSLPVQSPNMRAGSMCKQQAYALCVIDFTGEVQSSFADFVRRVNITAGTELRVQVGTHTIRVGHGNQQLAAALQDCVAVREHKRFVAFSEFTRLCCSQHR